MSKAKKLFVFDDGLHEYVIKDKETKKGRLISLYYSKAEHWREHLRGELILSMLSTGDGVKFSKNLKSIGYDDLHEMRLVINYERETDTNELNRNKSLILDITNDNEKLFMI